MDRKQLVIQTLAKAKKYQDLARWIGDQETVHRILDLVAKLKRRAQVAAKPSQNRILAAGPANLARERLPVGKG
jgi:hypothetical protein